MLVVRALPGLALLHIAGADERQGADDASGLPRGAQGQGDGMLLWRAGGGNHQGTQVARQVAAFVEHADRIMVAPQHQQRDASLVQLGNELVVQLPGIAGRRAGVENITSDQHGIHLALGSVLLLWANQVAGARLLVVFLLGVATWIVGNKMPN